MIALAEFVKDGEWHETVDEKGQTYRYRIVRRSGA